MEENKQNVKQNDTWKNILIGILLIAVIGLGGYVCFDKIIRFKGEQKVEKKEETPEDVTVDLKKVQEKVKSLNIMLHFALDYSFQNRRMEETEWYLPKNVKYNEELLDTDAKRMDFVYGVVATSGIDGVEYDIDVNGEEVTGGVAIPYETLKKYYKDLLGLELKESLTYPSNEYSYYITKDDMVYGGFWSGWTVLGTVMNYNSFTREGDEYILIVDVIADKDIEAKVITEDDYEFPTDKVDYKIQLKLKKATNDIYTIKSMQIIK